MTDTLTRRQRDVAELKAARLTRREIAQQLGITPAAVKQRLRRARASTRRRYGRALSSGAAPVRFRPFSLLVTDHV